MRTLVVVLLAFLLQPAQLTAATPPPAMPPELDQYITKAMTDWEVPGLAIAIVKDDRVVAAKGYGVRELGKPERVDGETLFDIASLTKSFTAAGAAVLVDEGKLSWDDHVRDRLPRVAFGDPWLDHEVTLRDLLSHRTGLQPANALFYFAGYDRDELLRRIRYLKPQAPFRSRMLYSNILYTAAGEMAAAAAGTSWADLIRHRLIEPAGMRSTIVDARPAGPNVAHPHMAIDGVQQPIRPFDFTMVAPASSILSSASDMARWLRLQLNDGSLDGKQIISHASIVEMHSPQVIIATTPEMRRARHVEHFGAYGLGWQIMDYRGEPILWHTGNADGMPSYMVLAPEKKLGVVVMINTWNAPALHMALGSRIVDFYLGLPPTDWSGEALERQKTATQSAMEQRKAIDDRRKTATGPGRPLADYAGTYDAELWGSLHVRPEGERLMLQVAGGESAVLFPVDIDTFHADWVDPTLRETFYGNLVTFGTEKGGHVARLSVTLNRDEVEAVRVP